MHQSVSNVLWFLAALFLAPLAPAPAPDATVEHRALRARAGARDSVLLKRVLDAERLFLARWREEWLASVSETYKELAPFGLEDSIGSLRAVSHWHCMRYGPWLGAQRYNPRLIPSAHTARSMCPSWDLFPGANRPDARVVIDSSLTDARRITVREARARLIALLDTGAFALPSDGWIAGQRVRFLLDQVELDRALQAALACRDERWWCRALEAFVLHRQGNIVAAESTFAVARSAMSRDALCSWDDVSVLLDSAARAEYRRLTCDARTQIETTLWWLADPLWIEPGNERRVEQDSRRVSLILRSALPKSERFNWRERDGGDAVAQMVLRYGWPAYIFWGGPTQDSGQAGIIRRYGGMFGTSDGAEASPPYTTAEYEPVRHAHTFPSWRAVVQPFEARVDDWSLHAPPDARAFEWWAAEHFGRLRPLAQLADQQSVALRRDTAVLLAIATALVGLGDSMTDRSDTMMATLLESTGPNRAEIIMQRRARSGDRIVMKAGIPSRPVLIGVEARSVMPLGRDLRTRFALVPPLTLSEMGPNEVAVSDPVLLTVPLEGQLPNETADALERMHPTTRLRRIARVGVFWETYGFAPDDSVDVSLRVERVDRPGGLARVVIALGVKQDPRGGADLRWRERVGSGVNQTLSGRVSVVPRSLVLDMSAIAAGRYMMEIAVSRPGAAPTRSRREFSIVE